jgi:hypothetical protein
VASTAATISTTRPSFSRAQSSRGADVTAIDPHQPDTLTAGDAQAPQQTPGRHPILRRRRSH